MTTIAEFDWPPTNGPPTARELQALGVHGTVNGAAHRATLMNAIGQLLGIPPSGFNHGQSRLFQDGDIRLVWLLRRLAARNGADRTASNLARASQLMTGDVMLTVVTAARENSTSVTAVGPGPIETWHQGGLDFLGAEVPRLGVARASRVARLVWKAYSFLAPGGAAYDDKKSVAAQSGRAFGCRSALLFLASRARSTGNELDLDDILTVADLNDVEWVRSAKVRTAEALFLERMWTVTRELLPPTAF